MRILHVIHRLDREAGGTTALAVSMCEALAARGHNVSLYSLNRKTQGSTFLPENAGFHVRLFEPDLGPLAFAVDMMRAFRMEMSSFDFLHSHMLYRLPQAFACHFARSVGVPYCVQPHGALEPILFHKRKRRYAKRLYEAAIENRNLRRATGLIYTTEGERDAASFLHLPPPAHIVPAGINFAEYQADADIEGFKTRHRLVGRDVILWMGRIAQVKALPVLIEAFVQLAQNNPRVSLVIAGPDQDGERPSLEKRLHQAGFRDRAVFTGMIHADEKLAALKAAKLFVLPSYTENFGISAMEAMAAGCPVIVSDNVKIAPGIIAAGAGLVAPVEATELASAMHFLLRDPTRLAKMGKSAIQLAAGHDWSAVAERLEGIYQTMIRAHAGRSGS